MLTLLALSLSLASGSRQPVPGKLNAADTTCVRVTTVVGSAARADTTHLVRCVVPRVDTVRVTRVDTVRVVRVDTLWRPRPDSTPRDSVPPDSLPTDSLPSDTLPTPQPSGVAELPRAVPTWPAALATAACTDTVTTSLQVALGAARAGDVLCLSGVFRGNFTLPARGDSGWVVLRSLLSPIAPGTRVRPSQRADLAMVVASGTLPALTTAPAARGWYVRELEIATDSSLTTLTYALIDLAAPPTADAFARDLVFDRVYAHGWAHRPLRRCVALQSASTAVIHSWIDECHEKGSDSQAIWGSSGPGPFLIHDNYLAGAGENVMFGGSDPRFRGLHPSDITITRNHVHTPVSWKGRWTKKNLFELKNAQRVLVEGNVFDGSWADGQTGVALVVKSSNQGKSAQHRDNGTRDVTITRNLIVHAAAALHVMGLSGESGRYTDSVTRRVVIAENYADIGADPAYGHDNRGIAIWTAPEAVVLRRNTWLSPVGDGSAYNTGTSTNGAQLTLDGEARTYGRYGLMGCWVGPCVPATLRLALIGPGTPQAAGVVLVPTLDAALAAGFGISRATIDAATRGVVITP